MPAVRRTAHFFLFLIRVEHFLYCLPEWQCCPQDVIVKLHKNSELNKVDCVSERCSILFLYAV